MYGIGVMREIKVDVKENEILNSDPKLLSILLKDNSSGKNIIWATNDYAANGEGFSADDQILPNLITGENGELIKPRTEKTKEEKLARIRDKAEVFTPSWICNQMNNLVDEAWFGRKNPFNVEGDKSWKAKKDKIRFPKDKSWKDYVRSTRLEITCGEAPFVVSRYDTVSGNIIPVKDRIGLLDRKLRVVSENTKTKKQWFLWAKEAFKSMYAFECQGDNVLLARENLLFTFCDYYEKKFKVYPNREQFRTIAEIISWNVWQMDGLKFVIPNSCHEESSIQEGFFFGAEEEKPHPCPGCEKNDPNRHNGIYCYVMDWKEGKKVKFADLFKGRPK